MKELPGKYVFHTDTLYKNSDTAQVVRSEFQLRKDNTFQFSNNQNIAPSLTGTWKIDGKNSFVLLFYNSKGQIIWKCEYFNDYNKEALLFFDKKQKYLFFKEHFGDAQHAVEYA